MANITSFETRTGAVSSGNGDYTAAEITNVPAGGIAAIEVQAALAELDLEKAPLLSPTFTGVPAAPTASVATNTTQLATTAFVIANAGGGDSTTTAAQASRPAASNDGNTFYPNNGVSIQRDTGAVWAPWGPIYPLTAPVNADFAWINQDTATVTETNGGINLTGLAGTGFNLRIRKKALAAPYVVTALFSFGLHAGVNTSYGGLCFRNAGLGTLSTNWFKTAAAGMAFNASDFASPITTVGSATNATVTIGTGIVPDLIWLRIADNSTDRLYSYSTNGITFIQFHSVSDVTFLTADEVGFFVGTVHATYVPAVMLLSWTEA